MVVGRERHIRHLQCFDELVLKGSRNKDVVGRDAGLSGIDDFAPEDALCSNGEVASRVNDDGGFS